MDEHFQRFARYNQWANSRLYAAVGQLSEADYFRNLSGFFGSIHGTLNHILVGDRAWLRRIEGEGPTVRSLDEELYPDLDSLLQARQAEDHRIARLMADPGNEGFERIVSYKNMVGESHSYPLMILLSHVFNHQTHHRGQVHHMLSQLRTDPPPLDMIYFMIEESNQ